jgi:ribosomal protein L37AE/L43A
VEAIEMEKEKEKELNRCPHSSDGKHQFSLRLKDGIIFCRCCGKEFGVLIVSEE